MKKESLKRWQVNYIVTYQNRFFVDVYRKPIHSILQNIALVRGIDCAISPDSQVYDDDFLKAHTELKDEVSDLVYFRSSVNTKIRSADFRKMIDLVFEEQKFHPFLENSVEVSSQMQKYLYLYPFPKD